MVCMGDMRKCVGVLGDERGKSLAGSLGFHGSERGWLIWRMTGPSEIARRIILLSVLTIRCSMAFALSVLFPCRPFPRPFNGTTVRTAKSRPSSSSHSKITPLACTRESILGAEEKSKVISLPILYPTNSLV